MYPPMDWIERLTGLDPDMGSGATELLVATAVALAVVAIATRFVRRRRVSN